MSVVVIQQSNNKTFITQCGVVTIGHQCIYTGLVLIDGGIDHRHSPWWMGVQRKLVLPFVPLRYDAESETITPKDLHLYINNRLLEVIIKPMAITKIVPYSRFLIDLCAGYIGTCLPIVHNSKRVDTQCIVLPSKKIDPRLVYDSTSGHWVHADNLEFTSLGQTTTTAHDGYYFLHN